MGSERVCPQCQADLGHGPGPLCGPCTLARHGTTLDPAQQASAGMLAALRAVIAGVRERLAKATPGPWIGPCPSDQAHEVTRVVWTADGEAMVAQALSLHDVPDEEGFTQEQALYNAALIASAPADLTTLASACERLAEENERLRGERVVLAMLAADGPAFSSPLHAAMAKALRDRVLAEATPAPAGKAGDMSTGLTIDSSAPAGKGEG